MEQRRPLKRKRVESSTSLDEMASRSVLTTLLEEKKWDDVIKHCNKYPRDVIKTTDPSPLALACRLGAPPECMQVILRLAPDQVRRSIDARGTPLHEAIACETTDLKTIRLLIEADQQLTSPKPRATLVQDLDGQTPLHLLTKRRIPAHVMDDERQDFFLNVLELLVSSCPESVLIPDLGEYEEPPIVCALKANIFTTTNVSSEDIAARIEQIIYDMVVIMLQYCPQAASQVFNGYRGQYTALHSAVFHGRSADTIELLLDTEATHPSDQKPCLLGNTQGELPVHFSAMRGERPRTIALLAKAAPSAVIKRDASGLTPMHWTWIRYISNSMALGAEQGNATIELNRGAVTHHSRYSAFTSLEQNDFEADMSLARRMDPPVDFMRMRHIPEEVLQSVDECLCSQRTVEILKGIRDRMSNDSERIMWTRREIVVGLFWTKIVSLIEAARKATVSLPEDEGSFLVHAAFASECSVPAVSNIIASMLPEELVQQDSFGRLPIHYASMRGWHSWDWPRDGTPDSQASLLLARESLSVLKIALRHTPPEMLCVVDKDSKLPLHYAIETFVGACVRSSRNPSAAVLLESMLETLRDMMSGYSNALHRRDGKTKLIPFLHATATATEVDSEQGCDESHLSIVYELLRHDPTVLAHLSV